MDSGSHSDRYGIFCCDGNQTFFSTSLKSAMLSYSESTVHFSCLQIVYLRHILKLCFHLRLSSSVLRQGFETKTLHTLLQHSYFHSLVSPSPMHLTIPGKTHRPVERVPSFLWGPGSNLCPSYSDCWGCDFPQVHQATAETIHRITYNYLPSYPLQFIIHHSSYHLTLFKWATDSVATVL